MAEKKKMSNRKFRAILIPIVVVLTVTCIVATIVMNAYSMSLNTFLGRGEKHVVAAVGTENWDTKYYDKKYSTETGAGGSQQAAMTVAEEVGNEGEVLLKNNGVLPLAKNSAVTPMGYRYLSPIYGGTGSGSTTVEEFYVEATEAIGGAFKVNETFVNKMKKADIYEISSTDIKVVSNGSSGNGFDGATTSIYEYDPSAFASVAESCKDTTGIVFIGRVGGEGGDLQTTAYADGTPHELALSSLEKQTIKYAKQNCENVVVVINSSNIMELGELMSGEYEADAILWIGGPGCAGMQSLANILCGDANPSGRTVDLWSADFTADPTFANFGVFEYDNLYFEYYNPGTWSKGFQASYLEYEEGIYLGYRYYETANELGLIDYDSSVIYPFGYGLSYTEFKQEIVAFEETAKEIKVKVSVTNVGDKEGKDVVQLYYSAPYTSLDTQYKIEKASANLVAFDKTDVIKPGKSQTVELTFEKEDMASYCYTRENPDGTKGCYMLEEGKYVISLRKNSHDVIDLREADVSETEWYDNSNVRNYEKYGQAMLDDKGNATDIPAAAEANPEAKFVAAVNRFESSNTHMLNSATILSRSAWTSTQPSTPTSTTADEQTIQEFAEFDVNTDPEYGNVAGSKVYTETEPVSKADNGLTVADMRGKSYYDSSWDDLLDQIDYNEEGFDKLLFAGAYNTGKLDSIGKPETWDLDGPQGLTVYAKLGAGKDWCAWSSAPIMAATWNTDLIYDLGNAVGQEALTSGVNGWYGPGLNMHRSPFSGRNFEYFSEDPLLAGKMGAAEISGAGDNGVYAYPKHFAMNDAEARRDGWIEYATEQTIREIYLKPFEIAVKESRMTIKYISDNEGTVSTKVMRACNAIMASKNCIGATLCRSNDALLNGVLRSEWGFQGFVISDMQVYCSPARHDKAMRTGLDLWMSIASLYGYQTAEDVTSPTAKTCIRNSLHNICYTVANSNAMQNLAPGSISYYGLAPWEVGLIIGNVVIYTFALCSVGWMAVRTYDEKKHPDKYSKGKKNNDAA